MAGLEFVRWELHALGQQGTGPFRLVIHHSQGIIVEYFDTVTEALLRESELEALLVAARGLVHADLSWQGMAGGTAPRVAAIAH